MHQITTLIPCSDFVLQQEAYISQFHTRDARVLDPYNAIIKYATFLHRPLELWMFVPCGEDGKPLTNPWADDNDAGSEKELRQIEYNNAKERCLFEGFVIARESLKEVYNKKLDCGYIFGAMSGGTIESMSRHGIKLTHTALKEMYGS